MSGEISGVTSLGRVTIGGSLIGGGNSGTGQLLETGEIASDGHLGSVLIKGSVISGQNAGTGTLLLSGAILSRSADIGSVTIDGSIVGHSGSPVTIQAVGAAVKPATGADNAIGSVTVKGSVLYGNIIAGLDGDLQDANADASVGKISIGGNWMASNAVAGAHQGAAPGWGVGDTLQTVGDTSLAARIASIVIGGTVAGSPDAGDNFGFVAQQFGSLKIGKLLIPTAAVNADLPILLSDDVHLERIA